MSTCEQEICFFIGEMKFFVDAEKNLRQANGERGMTFGRLVGFVNPNNEQNKSAWPVKGWQVTIANEQGDEFTFDQVITVILNRRADKEQRQHLSDIEHDRRQHGEDRRHQVA